MCHEGSTIFKKQSTISFFIFILFFCSDSG